MSSTLVISVSYLSTSVVRSVMFSYKTMESLSPCTEHSYQQIVVYGI